MKYLGMDGSWELVHDSTAKQRGASRNYTYTCDPSEIGILGQLILT
jgi:hypothetical protein